MSRLVIEISDNTIQDVFDKVEIDFIEKLNRNPEVKQFTEEEEVLIKSMIKRTAELIVLNNPNRINQRK